MGAICRRVKLTVARKRICPLKVIIHQTDLPILSRNCQNGSKRAVVTTNTSVKKKVPLSSGVTCQPSAQIFLSTIHSSLRIWHQSFTTSSRIEKPNLVLHWVIASKLVLTTQVIQWSKHVVSLLVMKSPMNSLKNFLILSFHLDMVDTQLMLNIQLIWMLTNFPIPKLIQPESTFCPPDAEQAVPSVDSDFHQHALSKKDVKLKRLSSMVSFLLMVNSRVTTSHFTDPDHMPQNQMV